MILQSCLSLASKIDRSLCWKTDPASWVLLVLHWFRLSIGLSGRVSMSSSMIWIHRYCCVHLSFLGVSPFIFLVVSSVLLVWHRQLLHSTDTLIYSDTQDFVVLFFQRQVKCFEKDQGQQHDKWMNCQKDLLLHRSFFFFLFELLFEFFLSCSWVTPKECAVSVSLFPDKNTCHVDWHENLNTLPIISFHAFCITRIILHGNMRRLSTCINTSHDTLHDKKRRRTRHGTWQVESVDVLLVVSFLLEPTVSGIRTWSLTLVSVCLSQEDL